MNLTQQFIEKHQHLSPAEVALLLSKKPDLNRKFIIAQINGIQKAKNKLPEFYQNSNIIYPTSLSMEQCSSEQTAKYKSELIQGNNLIDLTGGFGIDSYYFSKRFKKVTYIEPNKELYKIADNNFKTLKANNISTYNLTTEDFLKNNTQKFDIAYIDPSRRDNTKRVYLLYDCTPNIIELTDEIFKVANKIMVKTAPLLDIKQSLKELKNVISVFVISVNNDCKEVIYILEKDKVCDYPQIHTTNISKNIQEFSFKYLEEKNRIINFSPPKKYLYEPNSAILKAGAFNSICNQYKVEKIAPNSHLYTSENLVSHFPGRTFKVEQVINYSPKEFKKTRIKQANISCRNFKVKPDEIRKKLNIKDGGKIYLFATMSSDNKPILISCVK
jgi:16S rRNA G966 N2-methylase RsmD